MGSFFGVTSLGPSNPFTVSLLSALGVTNFSDEEFKVAFDMMDAQGQGCVDKAQVYEILSNTYGFEPMPEEVNLFVTILDLATEGTLTWAQFSTGLRKIRDTVQGVAANAKQYHASSDLKQDRVKHLRAKKGPMEIFKHPMTTNMGYGWHEEEVFNERFPKTSCAETRFADHLVKNPPL